MLTFVALVLVANPTWVTDTKMKPPAKPLVLSGQGAPTDIMIVVAKKKTTLTVAGPAKLTITLIGIAEKKGKNPGTAGAVEVKLDKSKPQKVTFPAEIATFTIDKKPRWTATPPQVVELNLTDGKHTLQLTPAPTVKLGFGLGIAIAQEAAKLPEVATAEPVPPPDQPPPPPESSPAQPSPAAGGGEEPALAGNGAEPDIMGGPSAVPEPAPLGTEGYTFVGSPPPLTTLTGPKGSEKLLKVSINDGLELNALGPGRMIFDIHAHRDKDQQESLKPVIVGVMIDDVLIQTLSVDQPASPDLKATGETYTPSLRVTLRVPVEPGSHRVRLTLSDSAILGASIRPRFEALSSAEEPTVLSAEVARSEDLKAAAPLPEVYGSGGLSLLVAGWAPTAFPQAGAMAELDLNFQIPVAGPRLAAGLWVGYGRVDYNHNYADDRRTSGVSRSHLQVTNIPVFLEVRWSAPIAAPFGLEAGVGGGVLLTRIVDRSAGGTNDPGLKPVAGGVLQATGLYELGPGALLLKVQLIASKPSKSDVVRTFDAGGAVASLGYRLTFGKGNAQ